MRTSDFVIAINAVIDFREKGLVNPSVEFSVSEYMIEGKRISAASVLLMNSGIYFNIIMEGGEIL